jgi:membrane-associated phospholipid phosphatase
MHRLVACLIVVGFARTADAQEPQRWHKGGHRVAHLALTTVGAGLYLTSEYVVKDELAPHSCHWCVPPSVDTTVRDAVRWDNIDRADQLSNLTGFILAPVAAVGLVTIAGWDTGGDETSRWLDDTLPILESGIAAGLIGQVVKFSVGRERPLVHFAESPTLVSNIDDNVAFYSGHTTLAFSLAVSAGMVSHYRHYRMEPAVWITGLTVATATGYLRVAADKHYFTDVAVGAAAGAAVGVVIPTMLHRPTLEGLTVHATRNSIAVKGTF